MPRTDSTSPVQTDQATRLLEHLLTRAKAVRLEAVPEVFEAIERGSRPRDGGPDGDADAALSSLARQVVALPVQGSKVDLVTRAVVMYALSICKGNVSAAARVLGIERKAMERKVTRYRNGHGGDED